MLLFRLMGAGGGAPGAGSGAMLLSDSDGASGATDRAVDRLALGSGAGGGASTTGG